MSTAAGISEAMESAVISDVPIVVKSVLSILRGRRYCNIYSLEIWKNRGKLEISNKLTDSILVLP